MYLPPLKEYEHKRIIYLGQGNVKVRREFTDYIDITKNIKRIY
jgi:hypothetical protein